MPTHENITPSYFNPTFRHLSPKYSPLDNIDTDFKSKKNQFYTSKKYIMKNGTQVAAPTIFKNR